jgi:hypothetical protein
LKQDSFGFLPISEFLLYILFVFLIFFKPLFESKTHPGSRLAENCDASLKARRKFALEVVHEVGETPRLKK